MSRKPWACVSGLTLFKISSDPQWMEPDRWLYRDRITPFLENWGVVIMGVPRVPNRFFTPDVTTLEA